MITIPSDRCQSSRSLWGARRAAPAVVEALSADPPTVYRRSWWLRVACPVDACETAVSHHRVKTLGPAGVLRRCGAGHKYRVVIAAELLPVVGSW
jgi:hypothetical protein